MTDEVKCGGEVFKVLCVQSPSGIEEFFEHMSLLAGSRATLPVESSHLASGCCGLLDRAKTRFLIDHFKKKEHQLTETRNPNAEVFSSSGVIMPTSSTDERH